MPRTHLPKAQRLAHEWQNVHFEAAGVTLNGAEKQFILAITVGTFESDTLLIKYTKNMLDHNNHQNMHKLTPKTACTR